MMASRKIAPWVAALALAGCSKPAPAPTLAPAQKAVNSEENYPIVGVVRGVDASKNQVTIRHEPIPGLMDRMTMTFPVAEASDLADVRVGDEVEATLRIREGRSSLAGLAVTRPAPSPEADPPGRFSPRGPKPLAEGGEVPDFALTTQDGTPLKLSELRGKVVVLTFIYTRCPLPDFCPLIDRRFKELASKIRLVPGRADRVRLLSVSFDPEHDSPEVLRKHARVQGAEPQLWTFAVASHEELRKVAGALGLVYVAGGDEVSHNLSTSVIGADGRLRKRFSGRAWTADEALAEVRLALRPSDR